MVSAKIRAKVISSEQTVLNPGIAVDLAEIAPGDSSNLIVFCSRFRADIGSRSWPMMPSPQPILNAMVEVKKELQVNFTHLSNPQLDASDRRLIGTSVTSI